ncbi:hypothetical protein NESM_000659800 [Novymonas esmeraldas]|uniref:Uncharacterized protein n=1 Tax=Novymonas esmeraldas TaxID=1808958 RepID=A0AAW0EU75_9TRYP
MARQPRRSRSDGESRAARYCRATPSPPRRRASTVSRDRLLVLPDVPLLDSPEWSSEDELDNPTYNKRFRHRQHEEIRQRLQLRRAEGRPTARKSVAVVAAAAPAAATTTAHHQSEERHADTHAARSGATSVSGGDSPRVAQVTPPRAHAERRRRALPHGVPAQQPRTAPALGAGAAATAYPPSPSAASLSLTRTARRPASVSAGAMSTQWYFPASLSPQLSIDASATAAAAAAVVATTTTTTTSTTPNSAPVCSKTATPQEIAGCMSEEVRMMIAPSAVSAPPQPPPRYIAAVVTGQQELQLPHPAPITAAATARSSSPPPPPSMRGAAHGSRALAESPPLPLPLRYVAKTSPSTVDALVAPSAPTELAVRPLPSAAPSCYDYALYGSMAAAALDVAAPPRRAQRRGRGGVIDSGGGGSAAAPCVAAAFTSMQEVLYPYAVFTDGTDSDAPTVRVDDMEGSGGGSGGHGAVSGDGSETSMVGLSRPTALRLRSPALSCDDRGAEVDADVMLAYHSSHYRFLFHHLTGSAAGSAYCRRDTSGSSGSDEVAVSCEGDLPVGLGSPPLHCSGGDGGGAVRGAAAVSWATPRDRCDATAAAAAAPYSWYNNNHDGAAADTVAAAAPVVSPRDLAYASTASSSLRRSASVLDDDTYSIGAGAVTPTTAPRVTGGAADAEEFATAAAAAAPRHHRPVGGTAPVSLLCDAATQVMATDATAADVGTGAWYLVLPSWTPSAMHAALGTNGAGTPAPRIASRWASRSTRGECAAAEVQTSTADAALQPDTRRAPSAAPASAPRQRRSSFQPLCMPSLPVSGTSAPRCCPAGVRSATATLEAADRPGDSLVEAVPPPPPPPPLPHMSAGTTSSPSFSSGRRRATATTAVAEAAPPVALRGPPPSTRDTHASPDTAVAADDDDDDVSEGRRRRGYPRRGGGNSSRGLREAVPPPPPPPLPEDADMLSSVWDSVRTIVVGAGAGDVPSTAVVPQLGAPLPSSGVMGGVSAASRYDSVVTVHGSTVAAAPVGRRDQFGFRGQRVRDVPPPRSPPTSWSSVVAPAGDARATARRRLLRRPPPRDRLLGGLLGDRCSGGGGGGGLGGHDGAPPVVTPAIPVVVARGGVRCPDSARSCGSSCSTVHLAASAHSGAENAAERESGQWSWRGALPHEGGRLSEESVDLACWSASTTRTGPCIARLLDRRASPTPLVAPPPRAGENMCGSADVLLFPPLPAPPQVSFSLAPWTTAVTAPRGAVAPSAAGVGVHTHWRGGTRSSGRVAVDSGAALGGNEGASPAPRRPPARALSPIPVAVPRDARGGGGAEPVVLCAAAPGCPVPTDVIGAVRRGADGGETGVPSLTAANLRRQEQQQQQQQLDAPCAVSQLTTEDLLARITVLRLGIGQGTHRPGPFTSSLTDAAALGSRGRAAVTATAPATTRTPHRQSASRGGSEGGVFVPLRLPQLPDQCSPRRS